MIFGSVHGAFRAIVDAQWNVKSAGEVESSTGHFAIVEIPDHTGERAEMKDAVFSDNPTEAKIFDSIVAGWYIVIQDSQGNIGVLHADNKADSYLIFHNLESEYSEWANHE